MAEQRTTTSGPRHAHPRRAAEAPLDQAPAAAAARAALRLPAHDTAAGARRAAALGLQRSLGNRGMQRELPGAAQRASGPETPIDEARQAHDRAAAQYAAGAFEPALETWRGAYSLPQVDVRARGRIAYNMARCLIHLGRGDEAVAMLQEALLAPGADRANILEALRQARTGVDVPPPGGALPDLTPEQQAEADERAAEQIAAGDAAGRGGDFAGALAHFDSAYGLRGTSAIRHRTATARRGHALRELGRADEAISAFQEALGAAGTTDEERLTLLAEIRRLRTGQADADVPPLTEDEQRQRFQEAEAAFSAGSYAAALAGFTQIYAQPGARPEVRRRIVYDMALCHQRLQQFDQAIPLFEEMLLFPGVTDRDRAQALERVRQCRGGEIGPGVRADATASGGETRIFGGLVHFATGSAAIDSLGGDTVGALAGLLRERHGASPGASFRIAVVGGATSRWRGAADPTAAQRRNLALSWRRAGAVETAIVAQLPPADVAAGVYTTDTTASGDDLSQALGLDPDDNSWRLRSVLVSVWETTPAAGGAGGGGAP